MVTAFNALPFLLAPLKAAALGPADRGHFAYFQAALLVVINVSVLGSRLSAYKNNAVAERRLEIARWPLVTITLPIALLLGAAALVLQTDLPAPVQLGIGMAAIAAPLYTSLQIELAHVQTQFLPARILLMSAVPTAVDFAASGSLLFTGDFNLRTAIVVALLAEASRLLVVLVSRVRDMRRYRATARDTPNEKPRANLPFWRDSIRLSLPSAAPVLTSNIDVLIYGALASPKQLGLYAIAKIGFNLTQLAGQSVEGRALAAIRLGPRSVPFARITASFVGLCLLVAAGGVVAVLALFPSEFSSAASALPILVAAGALFTYCRWTLASLATTGRPLASWMVSTSSIVISIATSCLIALTPGGGALTMGLLFMTAQVLTLTVAGCALHVVGKKTIDTPEDVSTSVGQPQQDQAGQQMDSPGPGTHAAPRK